MNRNPILIRVDGTQEKGYERLMRCQILAAALQRRRRPVYFVSQLEPRALALGLKRAGNDWLDADSPAGTPEDCRELIQEVRRLNPAAVIVDDAEVSQEYLAELAGTGVLVISMDHLGLVHFPSQLIINPLLGPSKENYEYDPGTQLLLGQRFTLVRSEIRRNRPQRSKEPAPLTVVNGKTVTGNYFRALVALGEDDPHQRTLELAKIVLATPKIGRVDIIVRREHPDLEKLQALAAANPDRVELALEPAEIAARMTRCHFAITGGTGWSLEMACVGMPQLIFMQQEAYWPNAQRLEEEGCAAVLGWHENVSVQTIRSAIANLLGDPLERQAMARCGRQLIDGRGPDRLVNALEIVLHPAQAKELQREAA